MADSAELDALQAVVAGADTTVILPKGATADAFVAALVAWVEAADARIDALENP